MPASSLAMSLLWFALIVAAIPALLWLLKRTPLLGHAGAAQAVRVVSVTPIGTQQRLLTVEVGSGEDRRWLVLGVSPGRIETLHAMPPQSLPEGAGPEMPQAASFAALLQKVSRREPPRGA